MKSLSDYSAKDFGATAFVTKENLSRRITEVLGSMSYKVGDTLEILGVASFPAISEGGKSYQAVCGLVNGSKSQISIPMLLGEIFALVEGKTSRVKFDNGLIIVSIFDLLGKTLTIKSLYNYKSAVYNSDPNAPKVEITKSTPIFEPLVGLPVSMAKVNHPVENFLKPLMPVKIGDLKSQYVSPLTNILKALITQHGNEILEQEQRLKAILGDLLPHEKQMRYLLELSLRAELPKKLLAIRHETPSEMNTKLNSLKHYFKEDYFLDEKAVQSIFECWEEVLPGIETKKLIDPNTVTDIDGNVYKPRRIGDMKDFILEGKAIKSIFEFREEVLPEVKTKQQIDPATVTDIDGNVYKTVRIGNQVWMAENLRVSRYRNGDLIPNIVANDEWEKLDSGAWCNFDNNPKYDVDDGKLYNWYAVGDTRSIAPKGWHVPTDKEWEVLIDLLRKSKEKGSTQMEMQLWRFQYNAIKAIESCFKILPVGKRYGSLHCPFSFDSIFGRWWGANEYSYDNARYRDFDNNPFISKETIDNNKKHDKSLEGIGAWEFRSSHKWGFEGVLGASLKSDGNSVRCLMDYH